MRPRKARPEPTWDGTYEGMKRWQRRVVGLVITLGALFLLWATIVLFSPPPPTCHTEYAPVGEVTQFPGEASTNHRLVDVQVICP